MSGLSGGSSFGSRSSCSSSCGSWGPSHSSALKHKKKKKTKKTVKFDSSVKKRRIHHTITSQKSKSKRKREPLTPHERGVVGYSCSNHRINSSIRNGN